MTELSTGTTDVTGSFLSARIDALRDLAGAIPVLEDWGRRLALTLSAGGRLLIAGNGGSAAQAQHLAAEIVGRYARERRPFSALALGAEGATLTALVNDYPPDEVFARQVAAHGRRGDIIMGLSTSGRSANVRRALEVGNDLGLQTWALTGPGPNPIGAAAAERLMLLAPSTAIVQEIQLVAVHRLCTAMDDEILGPGEDRLGAL